MAIDKKRPDDLQLALPVLSSRRGAPSKHSAIEADAACVSEVLAGKRERFGELIERYKDAVYGVVRARVHDAHSSEDVSQEVFVHAFTALKQLRDPRMFMPWLLQIARHTAVRAGQKDTKRSAQRQLTGDEVHASFSNEEPVHERIGRVFSKVEELPEPYRQTVLLKYQVNLSCKEIAEREGVAVGTITSRLTRALLMLRNSLQEHG